jgi:hypothetical protein
LLLAVAVAAVTTWVVVVVVGLRLSWPLAEPQWADSSRLPLVQVGPVESTSITPCETVKTALPRLFVIQPTFKFSLQTQVSEAALTARYSCVAGLLTAAVEREALLESEVQPVVPEVLAQSRQTPCPVSMVIRVPLPERLASLVVAAAEVVGPVTAPDSMVSEAKAAAVLELTEITFSAPVVYPTPVVVVEPVRLAVLTVVRVDLVL